MFWKSIFFKVFWDKMVGKLQDITLIDFNRLIK